jgi:hypothetical protein
MKRFLALPKPVLVVALLCTSLAVGCTAAEITADINLIATLATSIGSIALQFSGNPLLASDVALIGQFKTLVTNLVSDTVANRAKGDSAMLAVLQSAETSIPAFFATANFQNQTLEGQIVNAGQDVISIVEVIAAYVQPTTALPPPPPAVRMASGRMFLIPARVKIKHDALRVQVVQHWNTVVCNSSPACMVN